MLVIGTKDREALPLRRAWCLFEVLHTMLLAGFALLVLALSSWMMSGWGSCWLMSVLPHAPSVVPTARPHREARGRTFRVFCLARAPTRSLSALVNAGHCDVALPCRQDSGDGGSGDDESSTASSEDWYITFWWMTEEGRKFLWGGGSEAPTQEC